MSGVLNLTSDMANVKKIVEHYNTTVYQNKFANTFLNRSQQRKLRYVFVSSPNELDGLDETFANAVFKAKMKPYDFHNKFYIIQYGSIYTNRNGTFEKKIVYQINKVINLNTNESQYVVSIITITSKPGDINGISPVTNSMANGRSVPKKHSFTELMNLILSKLYRKSTPTEVVPTFALTKEEIDTILNPPLVGGKKSKKRTTTKKRATTKKPVKKRTTTKKPIKKRTTTAKK